MKSPDTNPTPTPGRKCFFDTFTGLIPCAIVGVRYDALKSPRIVARLTASRGAYKKGEIVESRLHIIPRENVKRRKRGISIVGSNWRV
jgi:hypothetical protein